MNCDSSVITSREYIVYTYKKDVWIKFNLKPDVDVIVPYEVSLLILLPN